MKDVREDDHGKASLRLWIRMLRATRRIEAELRERLREDFGTTLPRFDVLAALHRRQDGLRMSELSRMLMVSNGNVTGIVDRLVADGMVSRAAIEGDKRATLVALTPDGRRAFEAMAEAHEGWITELFARLGREEIEDVTSRMARLGRDG
jgi:DNA-binding MarR family transcriptional regulator